MAKHSQYSCFYFGQVMFIYASSLKKKVQQYKRVGLTSHQTHFPKVTSIISFICFSQIFYALTSAC